MKGLNIILICETSHTLDRYYNVLPLVVVTKLQIVYHRGSIRAHAQQTIDFPKSNIQDVVRIYRQHTFYGEDCEKLNS